MRKRTDTKRIADALERIADALEKQPIADRRAPNVLDGYEATAAPQLDR